MRIEHRCLALLSLLGTLTLSAQATAAFVDDFQDGNILGWLSSTNGGISSSGVELHNASLMAFASHVGSGSPFVSNTTQSSLSRDFTFVASDILSFDMQGVATSASTCCVSVAHGKAGMTLTFLNFLNVPVGSVGAYFATSAGILASGESLIDSLQHHYEASMATFAAAAGIGNTSAVTKVNLMFKTQAGFVGGGNIYPNAGATAQVWFDNVSVSAVPEPGEAVLMLCGLGVLLAWQRAHASARKKLIPR